MDGSIEKYISSFPEETQVLLRLVRKAIKEEAPNATETIRYAIPTFKLNGNLVHYAAYKNHIGFYPGSEALIVFKDQIAGFKNAKGSVQFPIDKPMPIQLIKDIAAFRVKQNELKARAKKKG